MHDFEYSFTAEILKEKDSNPENIIEPEALKKLADLNCEFIIDIDVGS